MIKDKLEIKDLLKNENVNKFLNNIPWHLNGSIQQVDMIKKALLTENERFSHEFNHPYFSIITPVWNTQRKHLIDLFHSCVLQSWPYWELILIDNNSTSSETKETCKIWQAKDSRIKYHTLESNLGISGGRNIGLSLSKGNFYCFLDHDDIIHPQILGIYARILQKNPELNALYCNESQVNEDASKVLTCICKPNYEFSTLLRVNFICHFLAISKTSMDVLANKEEIFRSQYDGVEDHDLLLRLSTFPSFDIKHIPLFGYMWRAHKGSTAQEISEKPTVYPLAHKMLNEFCKKHHPNLSFEIQTKPNKNVLSRKFYHLKVTSKEKILIDVIIPYKDQVHHTLNCLRSLENQENSKNLNVILIDNNSENTETKIKIDRFISQSKGSFHSICIKKFSGPFNYAKIHNWAFKHLITEDFVLLLNNDVELTNTKSISYMVGELKLNPKIAFVGIRLNYPKFKKVQHGGIKIMPDIPFSGINAAEHLLGNDNDLPLDDHVISAVTFACTAFRSNLFRKLGGFDEVFFPNGLGDVDLCIKAIDEGYNNFYLGGIEGIHHESLSRSCADESFEQILFTESHGGILGKIRSHRLGIDLNTQFNNQTGLQTALPLRYKLADQINQNFKRFLSPLHRILRQILRQI